MHLVVIHYHWRPGGVRQVVESTLAEFAAELAADPPACVGVESMTLAAGHPPPASWARQIQTVLAGRVPVRWVADPWLAYASEWPGPPASARSAVAGAVDRLLRGLPPARVVLLENPAVGRHPVLASAVAAACEATGTRLVCRHHDFFFDGRWERWPDFRACGTTSLHDAIEATIPVGNGITHLTVSARDAVWLAGFRPVAFCPNHVAHADPPDAVECARGREWLRAAAGGAARVWLCPARILRRKNLAEAAIVARLLDPEASMVVTGGVSSPAESRYAAALSVANASRGTYRGNALHLGALAAAESSATGCPRLPVLMAVAEGVALASLFEGFGLPVLEAAGLSRRVVARRAACPDETAPAGVTLYDDLRVPWSLAGGDVERSRQQSAWEQWRRLMPPDAAECLDEPPWWHTDGPVPLSRLTITGQLHVWYALISSAGEPQVENVRRLNPWLHAPPQPTAAEEPLEPPRAGDRFAPVSIVDILSGHVPGVWPTAPPADITTSLDRRLPWANHYPLLWPGGADVPGQA